MPAATRCPQADNPDFPAFFAARARRFIAQNRLAFMGVLVLLSFVVLRASTINHANELFGVELKDARWAWLLELCGSLLIALSAAAAATSAAWRDRGGKT